MKLRIIEDRTQLHGIIQGLSSKRIMHTPNVIIIKHPIRDEYIVLKSRHNDETTCELKIDSFETFSEKRNWESDYEDLYQKNIIIEESLLNKSGREALLVII